MADERLRQKYEGNEAVSRWLSSGARRLPGAGESSPLSLDVVVDVGSEG
jgi:hypothetical protein